MFKYRQSLATACCVVLMVLGGGSPAHGEFIRENLTLSIYDNVTTNGNTEVGINTGFNLETLELDQPFIFTVETGLDMQWWVEDTQWSDLNVGAYGYTAISTEDGEFYFASTSPESTARWDNTGTTGLMYAVNNTTNTYNRSLENREDDIVFLENNLTDLGYDDISNSNNSTPGYYGNGNMEPEVGEGNLAVFGDEDSTNDYITLYLQGMRGIPPVGWNDATYELLSNSYQTGTDDNGDPLVDWLAVVTLERDGTLTIINCNDPDGDGVCDCEDTEQNGDGECVIDGINLGMRDNCPNVYNFNQIDSDGDGVGDACQVGSDSDGDNIEDDEDNCPNDYNPNQEDWNTDGEGDVCDDSDGDGAYDVADLCREDPYKTEPGQCGCSISDNDSDNDGTADCNDPDRDGDGFPNDQEERFGTDPDDSTSYPTRPTVSVSADNQTVDAGASVTLIATATAGSNDNDIAIEFFTWTQVDGEAVLGEEGEMTTDPDHPLTATSTWTFTAPIIGREADAIELTFQVQSTDTAGIQSESETPATITIIVQATGENNAPNPPSLSAPAIDSPDNFQIAELDELALVVGSDAVDIDSDPVTIQFMFDTDGNNVLTGDALFVFTVPADASGLTTWSYSGDALPEALQEDTQYYWSARACDDQGACSDLMVVGDDEPYAQFFVNQENAAPPAPDLDSPSDGATVDTLTPTFTVIYNAYPNTTDYYDTHTYFLQIARSADGFDNLEYEYELPSCTAGVNCADTQAEYEILNTLTEGEDYSWRVRYSDDPGEIHPAAGDFYTPSRSFTVDATRSTPEAPTLLSPDENVTVSTADATLSFQNNGDSDTADADLIFIVELATDSALSENLQVVDSDSNPERFVVDPEDDTRFSVVFTGLIEDINYYWRVTVSDGYSSSFARRRFFVNTDNAAPGAPGAVLPEDGAVWRTALKVPTLIATGWSDTEGEDVYCDFELTTSADGAIVADTYGSEPIAADMTGDAPPYQYTCQWSTSSLHLENSTVYQWRVTAYDGPDATAAASDTATFTFTTAVNFYQPEAPTLNNPYSGGTVQNLTPTLSICASKDDDQNSLTYEFELYPCANLSCEPVALNVPVEGENLVSVTPLAALTVGATYYWRARAVDDTDERHTSAWMAMASFTVDIDANMPYEPGVYYLSANAKYGLTDDQIFEAGSKAGDMAGLTVTIPTGALTVNTGDINLQIASAIRVPALPIGKVAVGDVIFLAPENFQFAGPVTVSIPVVSPGDADPTGLQVLTYDTAVGEWLQVDSTLSGDQQSVQIQVTHFCIYTLAMEDISAQSAGEPEPQTGGGDSGGLGGCFIDSLF